MASDLNDLRHRVEDAAVRYEAAQQQTQQARIKETQCLNELNALQADLDRALQEIRDAAPRGSDWKRHRGTPEPADG